MSSPNSLYRVSIGQFAEQFRNDMIPLGNRFCYFSAAAGLSSEDLREYLEEPVAALPPKVAALLPSVRILLVPYLERPDAERPAAKKSAKIPEQLLVTIEKPQEARTSSSGSMVTPDGAVLAFAVKDTDVADYHYYFYRAIAELVTANLDPSLDASYTTLLREEISASAHGEVDEIGWRLKQNLVRHGSPRRETKLFREYLRQSLIDTLTLYLHGICCDIDVETGPRQLASRWLKRRLHLLRETFPPPEGYAVFPEDVRA